jgi:hypothetical protein
MASFEKKRLAAAQAQPLFAVREGAGAGRTPSKELPASLDLMEVSSGGAFRFGEDGGKALCKRVGDRNTVSMPCSEEPEGGISTPASSVIPLEPLRTLRPCGTGNQAAATSEKAGHRARFGIHRGEGHGL